MNKVPVLVTGGAGYIGSHAVLALHDERLAGGGDRRPFQRLALTSFPRTCRSSRVDRGRGLVARIFAEQGIARDHAFRRLDRGAGIGQETAQVLYNNTLESRALIERRGRRGVPALHLFVDRGDLWQRRSACRSTRTIRKRADQSLRRVEADDRADARATRRRPIRFNYGALRYFNVAGRRPAGPGRPVEAGAPPI